MRWSLVVLATMAACGNENTGVGGARLKASLDLSHVIGLAIASSASPRQLAAAPDTPPDCMPSTLYALQDSGDMVITTVTETDQGSAATCTSSMQTEMAMAVFDTAHYDVITYQLPGLANCPGMMMGPQVGGCPMCEYVVLRKGDGALFCGSGASDIRRVEGPGDVLYLGQNPLIRLDMATDPPTSTVVDDGMQTGDQLMTFDVNNANDALADGSFGERVFKANGGLQNITTGAGSYQWLDPTGSDFFYAAQTPPLNRFETFHLAAGSYAQTLVGSFAMFGGGLNSGFALATASQAYGWDNSAGTSEIVDFEPSAAGGICGAMNGPWLACTNDSQCAGTCSVSLPNMCVGGPMAGMGCSTDAQCTYSCTLSGARHLLTGVPAIKSVVGTGSRMYVQGTDTAGNGMIVAVDVTAIQETACSTSVGACGNMACCSAPITPSVLLAAGAYTVNAISLSRTSELTFAGLRNSDGAKVVGNCVADTCTVVNATAPTVTALQRIN